ncbi:MAG TPA: serine hydrolase [Flavobacterium sp.]|nr:serine hydrolase [Flavobacterium sp.]
MKRSVAGVAVALMAILMLSSCKLGRFVYYNFANITDHKIFPKRDLQAAAVPYQFPVRPVSRSPKSVSYLGGEHSFEEFLDYSKTVAFVVIRNDTIQYERYFDGYDESKVVASFSMAKSVTSLLIGCALDDGLIKSIDEPVVKYVPELRAEGMEKVTIRHLLQMMSGIRFSESYSNPFGDAATYYYGTNLRRAISRRKLDNEPGTVFSYSSGDTQLLGLVLERALKDRSITAYLQEKIWTPLGMEHDASWSLDRKKDGLEKTFCCINATALDFAKIGRLALNKGEWNGKQLISRQWMEQSVVADTTNGQPSHYKFQWWLPNKRGDFMAQGILGQYIYVNPSKNVMIVRLGANYGGVGWREVLESLSEGY